MKSFELTKDKIIKLWNMFYNISLSMLRNETDAEDATNRFIYILGNIFNFKSKLAAEICRLNDDAYRKKLSRSREKIKNFMTENCGLINTKAFCQCKKRLKMANDRGYLDPEKMIYKNTDKNIKCYLKEMNKIDAIAKIFHDNPYFEKKELIMDVFQSKFEILN